MTSGLPSYEQHISCFKDDRPSSELKSPSPKRDRSPFKQQISCSKLDCPGSKLGSSASRSVRSTSDMKHSRSEVES